MVIVIVGVVVVLAVVLVLDSRDNRDGDKDNNTKVTNHTISAHVC